MLSPMIAEIIKADVDIHSIGSISGMSGEMSNMILNAAGVCKGKIDGMEPAADGCVGIIAVLIGLVERDVFDFTLQGIITTNEHASSTIVADEARSIITTNEHASSTFMAGFNAGGGWDPTSVHSPRDAASGYIEAEWLDF